ncbi:hypothetical protein A1F94_000944 [Pyrenophora tritici-repentis]|uniref:Uncharacterized protein n=2 Tax=Pyrenophora tritici-repentis TaxID=45151 RepID=A0A2W1FNY5_9PLEO|nr:uncharacterized protein PTRG_01251 [Pyrenophora tritici-repentis Pt-1C-BFP]KAF7454305.1 hypothetical protein A1F99_015630 [Pyrenophora tritici-repentis]EDU40689.1 predicted protein [Pyrenophora tritici-repentis Pt-1C-BFP]KAF7577407.1 hypothetical protein PtrM4_016470 [Pyrenophora tritici-repentis]KAG9388052.1 hypothetical protein A1F94_000944 [Pyrenophora tritici-repentis]KAI1513359.1 hypothetical protein Ptr86124_007261 [Pyrenophora tritici-repentis]
MIYCIIKGIQDLTFGATRKTSTDSTAAVKGGDSTNVGITTNSSSFLDLPHDIRRMVYDILPEPTFHNLSFPGGYMACSDYTQVSNLRQTSQYLNQEAGVYLDIQRAILLSRSDLVIAVKPTPGITSTGSIPAHLDNNDLTLNLLNRLLTVLSEAQNPNITDYTTATTALDRLTFSYLEELLLLLVYYLNKNNGLSLGLAELTEDLKAALSNMLLQLRQNAKVQIRWYVDRDDLDTRFHTWANTQFLPRHARDHCKNLDYQMVVMVKDEATVTG